MPGRLLAMDTVSAKDAEQWSNGVAHQPDATALLAKRRPDATQKPAGAPHLANGDHSPSPMTNGAMPSSAPLLDLPEDVLDIIANSFSPLSQLIERVGQECFNDLSDLIGKMADVELPPAVNGASVNGAGNALAASAEKKRLLLDFANKHREKFIKLLVLSQWSRRAADVESLVKLKTWLTMRLGDFISAADMIGELKRNLHFFKEPNPDIRTALEILSSATASWIPDLGYIAPEPMSNEKMAETLTNLDALLSIRINLQEDLPWHLKQWHIANGRATFRIPDEFEFDVTIVTEDPSAQFYFLDIRFLFSPAPELPDSQVRVALEDRANQLLGDSGLSGCYDFLHDFVLTHKLNVLRRQAHELSHGVWFNHVRVETIRRSLVVQYWTGSQTGKSWLEIGISSGKPKTGQISWRGAEPSRLGVRWFRNGNELADLDLAFDWKSLSMERMLKHVICRHISFILNSIEHGISNSPGGQGLDVCRLSTSEDEPTDCSLAVRIPGQTSSTDLAVEPIAGRLSLFPQSQISSRTEVDLNSQKHPEENGHIILTRYLAREMQNYTERQAVHAGWRVLKGLRLENAAAAFKDNIVTMSFFRGQSWGRVPWAIAATVTLSGESWWTVELSDPSMGGSIVSVHPLQVSKPGSARHSSPEALRQIERRAIADISLHVNSKELQDSNAGHSLQQELIPTASASAPSSEGAAPGRTMLTLLVQSEKLLRGAEAGSLPFADKTIRLNVHNYSRSKNLVEYHVRGRVPKSKAKDFSDTLTAVRDKDVAFSRDGAFALRIAAPFGSPCTRTLVNRLLSLQRVRNFVGSLKRNHLRVRSVTLARIAFEYPAVKATDASTTASTPPLSAEVTFTSASSDTAPVVAVFFPASNPHRRIQSLMTQMLNQKIPGKPDHPYLYWLILLLMNLPVLRALDAMEDRELAAGATSPSGLTIHARSVVCYRLTYKQKALTLEVRLRRSRDEVLWMIEEIPPPRPHLGPQQQRVERPQKSPALADALKRAWRERGVGWRGLMSCIKANHKGVEEALLRLDQVIRSEAVPEAAIAQAGAGAQAVVAPQLPGHEVITLD